MAKLATNLILRNSGYVWQTGLYYVVPDTAQALMSASAALDRLQATLLLK